MPKSEPQRSYLIARMPPITEDMTAHTVIKITTYRRFCPQTGKPYFIETGDFPYGEEPDTVTHKRRTYWRLNAYPGS